MAVALPAAVGACKRSVLRTLLTPNSKSHRRVVPDATEASSKDEHFFPREGMVPTQARVKTAPPQPRARDKGGEGSEASGARKPRAGRSEGGGGAGPAGPCVRGPCRRVPAPTPAGVPRPLSVVCCLSLRGARVRGSNLLLSRVLWLRQTCRGRGIPDARRAGAAPGAAPAVAEWSPVKSSCLVVARPHPRVRGWVL